MECRKAKHMLHKVFSGTMAASELMQQKLHMWFLPLGF